MEKQRKRIAFDNDEVIVAFARTLLEFHNAKYGTSAQLAEMPRFHFEEALGLERTEWLRRIDEFYASENFKNLPPIDGAIEVLTELAKTHELVVITARPSHVEHLTHAWLDANVPGVFSSVYHVGLRDRHTEKAEKCRELDVMLFIDDNADTIQTCIEQGVPAVLFDAPWNKQHVSVPRVHTWHELLAYIRSIDDEM